nr:MAG TPA: hypothetical protein [Caudoviricetes sp.]
MSSFGIFASFVCFFSGFHVVICSKVANLECQQATIDQYIRLASTMPKKYTPKT